MCNILVVGVTIIYSSFGKDLASGSTYTTIGSKLLQYGGGFRILSLPFTSNKRKASHYFCSVLKKRLQGTTIRSPLLHRVATRCAILPSNATMVSVTSTDKLALLGDDRHSTIGISSLKDKRLVYSTTRRKTGRVVLKLNNDTAASTKANVLCTLNVQFFSRSNIRILPSNRGVVQIGGVQQARGFREFGSVGFALTYSIAGPLYKRGKTTCIFSPRGKTSGGSIRLLSSNLQGVKRVFRGRSNGGVVGLPKTKTTNNVNNNLSTFLGYRLRDKFSILTETTSLRSGVHHSSTIVANRNGASERALFNGLPGEISSVTEGFNIPYVLLDNSIRGSVSTRGLKMYRVRGVGRGNVDLRRYVGGTTSLLSRETFAVNGSSGVVGGRCDEGRRGVQRGREWVVWSLGC